MSEPLPLVNRLEFTAETPNSTVPRLRLPRLPLKTPLLLLLQPTPLPLKLALSKLLALPPHLALLPRRLVLLPLLTLVVPSLLALLALSPPSYKCTGERAPDVAIRMMYYHNNKAFFSFLDKYDKSFDDLVSLAFSIFRMGTWVQSRRMAQVHT